MRGGVPSLALVATVLAGCGGERDPALEPVREREVVQVGALGVEFQQRADGRYHACVVANAAGGLPDQPLCVGPHDGAAGPRHSWSQADRVGDDIVFVAILGAGDSLVDERFTVVVSSRFPVAVAGGVLHDDTADIVCTTFESGGMLYRYDTGVTANGEVSGASTDPTACGP